MAKNTLVSLGNNFEQIIENSIKSGRYTSASEDIRAGLRMVDEREQKIQILKDTIEAGERSGYVKNFDPIKHLALLSEKFVNKNKICNK